MVEELLKMRARMRIPIDRYVLALLSQVDGLDKEKPLNFDWGRAIRFTFTTSEERMEGMKASVMCSMKLVPGSRLHKLLLGMGVEPKEGEEVNIQSLVGKGFEILVSEPGKSGFQNVEHVRPLRVDRSAAQAVKKTQAK